jgi:hypothetical protein
MEDIRTYFTQSLSIAQGYATYEGRPEVTSNDIIMGLRAHLLNIAEISNTSIHTPKLAVISPTEDATSKAYASTLRAQIQWDSWLPQTDATRRLKKTVDAYEIQLKSLDS